MAEASLDIAAPVRDLGRLMRSALTGAGADTGIDGVSIDAAFADFAIRRHKCGPLLYQASLNGARADDNATAALREHWEWNRHQYLRNLVSTERVGAALGAAAIPALTFKGAPLAQALYPDPLWRHCGDIDILIPRDSMIDALRALSAAGLYCTDAILGLPEAAQRIVFGITRDVALDDGWTQSHVELHSRLLFSKRLSAFIAGRDATLRPGPIPADGTLAAPALTENLGLYLFFHGGISGWCRLKWLVDLIPLLERLGPAGRQSLADGAERCGTAVAVKASLLLLRAACGRMEIGSLDDWLAEKAGASSVQTRVRLYAGWLSGAESRMPVASRTAMLKSTMLLNDRLSDKIGLLLAAGLSSGIRQLTDALAPKRDTVPVTVPD
jgi:hypothetical protein